ncbi:MAG: zinc-ribbon domain-containing protein [Nitrososphaerales archaeon]|jgi:hypothetical protein
MSQESRFCNRCGAALTQGSAFCSKCGAPVAPTQAVPPSTPGQPGDGRWERRWERRRERYERYEKHEKQEKHEKNEKGRGGDLAGALTGGMILVLLGVLSYLSENGSKIVTWSNFWGYLMLGIGVILILQGALRMAMRGRPYIGSFIGGAILLVIGASAVASANLDLWPLILVAVGVGVMASAFVGRRRAPRP